MSEETEIPWKRGNKMAGDSDYAEKVKAAVCKLLDYVLGGKFYELGIDTDEDAPFVNAWVGGKKYIAVGQKTDGLISPESEEESWSFLECCEQCLAAIEKDIPKPVRHDPSKLDALVEVIRKS